MDTFVHRLFQFSFVAVAIFIPFSIAGTNIALGFAALAWVLSGIAARQPGSMFSGRDMSIRKDPMLLASILLVISAIPSVLISEDAGRAYHDWESYWQLLIYFMVATSVTVVRMREPVLWVLLASSSISCLVAFVQRAGGIDLGFIHIGGQERVSSTMFTMTFSGILYQLIVLYAAAAMGAARSSRSRLVLACAAGIQFITILLTMTRGAWAAVIVGLGVVLILVRNKLSLIVAAVAVVGLVGFSLVFSVSHERNMSIIGLFNGAVDFTVATRFVLWDIAWDLFKQNPLLGVGMGDYTIEANKLLAGRTVTTTVDAHNAILQVLATRGLVGFLPFVYFWYALLKTLIRAKRSQVKSSIGYQFAVGAIAATAAILVGSMTELAIDDSEVFMAFMVIVGLATSSLYRSTDAL